MRLIRVMCSGRVDLEFILRAFSNGQDGVFIGGCKLGECNYVTHGNYDALGNVYLCKKLMGHIGLNPDRLRISFMSGADGNLLAELADTFARSVRELGPIGSGEGVAWEVLKGRIDAVRNLVPYIRLVERERMRIPEKSPDAFAAFFTGADFDRLFDELIARPLAMGRIAALLAQEPMSMARMAEELGMHPSEMSRHIGDSTRQGVVRYDPGRQCYRLT